MTNEEIIQYLNENGITVYTDQPNNRIDWFGHINQQAIRGHAAYDMLTKTLRTLALRVNHPEKN